MISLRKVNAITIMKFKMILKNSSILLGPLMAIAFVVIFKNIMNVEDAPEMMKPYFLQLGVLFNILLTGVMATSMPLAEEKEKNTLRVLMTSSVNGLEFFIGSLIPVLLIIVSVNVILLPISGLMDINIPMYIFLTTIASCITMVLGMIVGLVSKTQMATSLLSTPLVLIFMMIPMFSNFNDTFGKVAGFIYSGTLYKTISNLVLKHNPIIDMQGILVMVVWTIILIVAFLYFYKKNGLETD